ncbi:leucine-rich repeat extensin-like protein 5 [Plectropomus leopardus]|uniref:leucine-rich repeat extensin-like protein 5 n=1 Tax=Plectropomus leopardus TaxID=160734 RepID=UPI001C4D7930|nr:leucine-rich repeat extensin-like protein 5 [Plectropomus leopardus]
MSNMVDGLSLRVSWICVLLFSSAASFPATKGDYRYPYTWRSGGGSAPGSDLQSEGSGLLVKLQYEPEAAPKKSSSPTGNQTPSSAAADSSPNRFTVTFDSSGPGSASQSAGYVSPPLPPPPPGPGKKAPGSSAGPQSAAWNTFPALDFGDGPVPYIGGPPPSAGSLSAADDGRDDGPVFYGGAGAASQSAGYVSPPRPPPPPGPGKKAPGSSAGPQSAAWASASDGSSPYAAAPSAADSADEDSVPGLPWASFPEPSSWMPSRDFPDFSVWDSNAEMQRSDAASNTSPELPSSYIVQSRNGYQRMHEFLSHTKYDPEYAAPPPPQVFDSEPVEAPYWSPPETGSKGGRKA